MATDTPARAPEPVVDRRRQPLPSWIVPTVVLIAASWIEWFLWRWVDTLNFADPIQRATTTSTFALLV
jgi:hypothetical protein